MIGGDQGSLFHPLRAALYQSDPFPLTVPVILCVYAWNFFQEIDQPRLLSSISASLWTRIFLISKQAVDLSSLRFVIRLWIMPSMRACCMYFMFGLMFLYSQGFDVTLRW